MTSRAGPNSYLALSRADFSVSSWSVHVATGAGVTRRRFPWQKGNFCGRLC
ncbi:hypothetical protein DPMN_008364 [Dreissena polymorpha]|uniref:Uncharacterized protein n=1 Tax=Dreissena polymorpha TaxID=45954 RepID=A0A9D4RWV3_DREPO|nr:hypothetical protein DPMN_008364 [Dreissena polymorpha]